MMHVETAFEARSGCVSERGRRQRNEDAALAVRLGDGGELLAVADGMGGHAAGEVASGRALETLRSALERGETLRAAVELANQAVLEEAGSRPEWAGMGTTLVALLRRGGEYEIANVGDSRAYRVDESGVRQLTRDHSFVEDAVRSGQLTAQEADASPWRNALTRAVGLGPELEVDCYGPFSAAEPHAVVLCTDGLYRALPDEQIAAALSTPGEPAAAARELAGAAEQAGSDDNISLAVVRFGSFPPRSATGAAPAGQGRNGTRPAVGTRPRRRRPGHVRRWARVEVAAILLGLIAVMLYVLVLTRVL